MTARWWAFLIATGVAAGALLIDPAAVLPDRLEDRLIQEAVRWSLRSVRTEIFHDGQVHVVILGSGTPQAGTGRLPQSTAIIAGDRFIVVDAGEGAGRQIADLKIPVERVTDILITHFHSDHIGGLGQLLNQSWNAGRTHPIVVRGPRGLQALMSALERFYAPDIRYRSAGSVESNDPTLALGDVQSFELVDGENEWILSDEDGVRIVAFRVDHGHVFPAVGYRIEALGRTVVISGDTKATPLMVQAAKDADILIHEVVNARMMRNAAVGLDRAGLPTEAARARGIVAYHADTLEVADIGRVADVGHLVLSHLLPAPPNRIVERLFVEGMDQRFDGKITVARDGIEFTLAPR